MNVKTQEASASRTSPIVRSQLLRRTLLACVAAMSLAVLATYWDFSKPPYLTANDFSPDYVSARELLHGNDPYAPLAPLHRKYFPGDAFAGHYDPGQRNAHPPTLIVFTVPFSLFGFRASRILHMVVMMGAGGLAIWLFVRRLGLSPPLAGVLTLAGLALPVTEYDARWGGASGLILLALVLAWIDLRGGRDARAGAILGCAVALKVFPWILIVPLVRLRRGRAAAWLVGTAGVVSLAATLVIGPSHVKEFVTEASGNNFRNWSAAPHSISLVSLPFRLFASDRWFQPTIGISAWVSFLAATMLAVCVIGIWRTTGRISGDAFWASIPWMILASPLAWAHYVVLVIPLGILLIAAMSRRPWPSRMAMTAVLGVLALGVTFVIWSSDLFGFSLSYGNQVATASVLVAALAGVALVGVGRGPAQLRVDPLSLEPEIEGSRSSG